MSNLLAYIPTLNQRHLNWFKEHPNSDLFLIPQDMAEKLLPRLSRNMSAVSTEIMAEMIRHIGVVKSVTIIKPEKALPVGKLVLADEDVSYLFVGILNDTELNSFEFEMIWARWDMTAVLKEQPVLPDIVVSQTMFHNSLLSWAHEHSQKSPDWWRRVGAIIENPKEGLLALSYNTHMPNEYETYIFGDPAINRDAGQKGKSCALHAERAAIAFCAKFGKKVEGSDLYATTFPCEDCAREIAFAGIKRVFFREGYSVLNAQEVLSSHGVEIVQVVEDPGPL